MDDVSPPPTGRSPPLRRASGAEHPESPRLRGRRALNFGEEATAPPGSFSPAGGSARVSGAEGGLASSLRSLGLQGGPPGVAATEGAAAEAAALVAEAAADVAAAHQQTRRVSPMTVRPGYREPVFLGVAGGTASGKTTCCDAIMQRLVTQCAVLLSQDSFYKELTPEETARASTGDYDFDSPEAFDEKLLCETLEELRQGRPVLVPDYDFATHRRVPDKSRWTRVCPSDVVVIEGILVLAMPRVRAFCGLKIFVDTDDDVRLARRIRRDVADRGRDVAGVLQQYTRFVKPAFEAHVQPSKRHADIIIPWGSGINDAAVNLIVQHISSKVELPHLQRLFPRLHLIDSSPQIRGLHTILRDKDTSKSDFIFYADRLLRIVVEFGLGQLPFVERTVTTPTGRPYVGVDFARRLCAVSMIRSGEAMEAALRACCKGVKIGKVLVQRDRCDGDVAAAKDAGGDDKGADYVRLPADIEDRHVLLLDPILATGGSACTAIDTILSAGVPESRIIFLTLIAGPEGVRRVCTRHPSITVVASEIDEGVEGGLLVPGLGDFGNRYYSD